MVSLIDDDLGFDSDMRFSLAVVPARDIYRWILDNRMLLFLIYARLLLKRANIIIKLVLRHCYNTPA
jgi:hypothetical protein